MDPNLFKNLKETVVVYHADCPDGFGGAWSAWKKFGESASYIPCINRATVPEEFAGKKVYTVDYSFSEEEVRRSAPKSAAWVIIDHHITNKPALALASDSLYALDHSGAVLAWNYFHPSEPTPKLLSYIEDSDLWRFALPHAPELATAIGAQERTFQSWTLLAASLETPEGFTKLVEQGAFLHSIAAREIEQLVKNAEEVTFEGHRVLAVNSAQSKYTSELGHQLYAKMPPMALIWSRRGKRVVVSLRSNGSIDVSKIAQKYGGGGHAAAAAFSWETDEFFKNVMPPQAERGEPTR